MSILQETRKLQLYRYPGSKLKYVDFLIEKMRGSIQRSNAYCEPFVGGGSMLLAVALSFPDAELFINDKDKLIASFWKCIQCPEKIETLIGFLNIKPTVELFNDLKYIDGNDEIYLAFKGIFLNRTAFSGIMKSNPIGGKSQNSKWDIGCRYNFESLKKKIYSIHNLLKDRKLHVDNSDFRNYSKLQSEIPSFIDPPYYVVGNSLYNETMNASDHIDLFHILDKRKYWFLTYDNCDFIKNLYYTSRIEYFDTRYSINGKKTNWTENKEILISREEQ